MPPPRDSDFMTMRRSPRRPLILKRRKLPFQQNDPPPAKLSYLADIPESKEVQTAAAVQGIPDGVYVVDHPTSSDTQVVVVPREADLQSVIGFFTVMGKESGAQGPNKFILLNGSGDQDVGTVCQPVAGDCASAVACSTEELVKQELITEQGSTPDDSLTNIQWLGKVSSCASETKSEIQNDQSENHTETLKVQNLQLEPKLNMKPAVSVRPPYSYMAMIQFAINSHREKRMTLKEIYTWIEDHFPFFREVAKPGWKNSIRHNLSLHDMFIRETSSDGKISFWTIKPEANRCLTLDQAFKPGSDPITTPVPVSMLLLPQQQHKKMIPDLRKTPIGCERKIKPLLPRTNSYLVPIQIPIPSHLYLPTPCAPAHVAPSCPDERRNTSREGKRVRIAPKVVLGDATNLSVYPGSQEMKVEPEEHLLCGPDQCRTPRSLPKRQASSSRRKQCLARSLQEEPVLLCPDNSFLDSGLASDVSTFHEKREADPDEQLSPDRDYSFKTPIKSSGQLNSSTPSKTPSGVLPEPWKVTPLSKGCQNILDFSPIRTPGGPAVTPSHDYTTFSLNSTPFKDLQLFGSPRETLIRESPVRFPSSSCSRELLQTGGSSQANRSITEGLVLDTLNDSLSKILVDISFTGLEDEDLGMANISWSFLN